jgi:hypothetical protein
MLNYDMHDGDYFMEKLFKVVLKQAKIVKKNNKYTDVGDDSNLPNDVGMFSQLRSKFLLSYSLKLSRLVYRVYYQKTYSF